MRVCYTSARPVRFGDPASHVARSFPKQFAVGNARNQDGSRKSVPRALRIEYPGAIYHVLNRGDRREPIFRDDLDHQKFLSTLAEVCTKTAGRFRRCVCWGISFIWGVEAPPGNLVTGMKWFPGTYTARFNRRHKLFGPQVLATGRRRYAGEMEETLIPMEDSPNY